MEKDMKLEGCACHHDHEHEHGHEHHHEHDHEHEEEHGCCCGHCHDHGHEEESLKTLIIRLVAGGILFAAGFFAPSPADTFLFLAAYIVLAYDIVISAVRNIFGGHIFDENLLMTVASVGAFLVGEHPEAAAVMLFYQIGELLQDSAVEKSRRSITELMDIRPDYANVVRDGKTVRVSPETVAVGGVIVVNPGEKVPLDGCVVKGSSFVDNKALTGESVPVKVSDGDKVLSGAVNSGSPLWIRTEKLFGESTVSRILDMVQYSQSQKARSEKFITTFARYYTPIVVGLAALVMLIPSIITGDVRTWIYRGLMFLVVSCPCALVVSVPLSFFAGIGCASKNGILVKGSNYLEALSKLDSVVFDKTGTLTKGEFKVTEIAAKGDREELLKTAAYCEYYSSHPIAKSIKAEYGQPIPEAEISNYKEIAGMGISAEINGKTVLLGNERLIPEAEASDKNGTIIHVSIDGKYAGYLVIDDIIKEDSQKTIAGLNTQGIHITMLTGDAEKSAEYVGKKLGIQQVFSQLLPVDKVSRLEQIIKRKRQKSTVAFVGDGINDAPVLARADVGIAMGGLGSDSAIEAADVVLMTDEPSKILAAIGIAKKTMTIITENIIFALGVKVLIMIFSALGLSNMWVAIFGDVGVALLAVLNSLRALYFQIKE